MPQLCGYNCMARRGAFRVGDLRQAGDGQLAGWRDTLDRAPSWLIVAASCLSPLTMFGTCAGFWLAYTEHPSRSITAAAYRGTVLSPSVPALETFPSWIEVPHLSEPGGHEAFAVARTSDDPDGASRSLLVPQPDMADRLIIVSKRTDSPGDAFGMMPLDAEAWIAAAHEPARALAVEPSSVEVAVLSPPLASTIGPATTMRARSILPAGPVRYDRRPVIEVRRPARLGQDADQTASIIGLPRSVRPQLDAGAIARASVRRPHAGSPSGSQAPSPPVTWTLPPALAPSP